MKTISVIFVISSVFAQLKGQEIDELKKFEFQKWDGLKTGNYFTETRKQEIAKDLRSAISSLKNREETWEKDFDGTVDHMTVAVDQVHFRHIGIQTTEWVPVIATGLDVYSKNILEIRANGKENRSEEKFLSLVTKMEYGEFFDSLLALKDHFAADYSFIPSKQNPWSAPQYGLNERYLFALVASDPVRAWKLFFVNGSEAEKELYFYGVSDHVNSVNGALSEEKILDTAGLFINNCLASALESKNEALIKDAILTANQILRNSFYREGFNWATNEKFQEYIKEVNDAARSHHLDENTVFREEKMPTKFNLLPPNKNFVPERD